jgi:hypothetical protein
MFVRRSRQRSFNSAMVRLDAPIDNGKFVHYPFRKFKAVTTFQTTGQ